MLIGGTLLSRSSAGWGISWSSGRSTECKVDPPYALAETVTAGATRRLRGADPLVVPRPFALANPSAGEGLVVGCLVFEVTAHHDVAAHHYLAHRLAVLWHILHLFVDHTDEIGGQIGLALPREQLGALLDRKLAPSLLLRRHGCRTVRLRQAVHVHDPEVQLAHASEERR